ncbi:uncharacterized protein L969DRAFT_43069 [Mixia osmundae IAM 14324]|uniref:Peroxisomal ATPase PEX6 n=1 Tax=Mixia osmundae (strain CBS 9802 / IAM 14324 / JCM 22182 / KY 12970) TaxID=764103 RepID=G7E326_MIXOS|nr:uncharacterized protein L969DRAFT_43069 [Mixia osmundae IAM 14324]KEI42504.1 hypothetical protein L969DRAFT_43069 [Mixia osmundae IAM 14324]GAA97207.1 hypothetical protein E5Q_03883 [Mixia osmundae IAM 14324]
MLVSSSAYLSSFSAGLRALVPAGDAVETSASSSKTDTVELSPAAWQLLLEASDWSAQTHAAPTHSAVTEKDEFFAAPPSAQPSRLGLALRRTYPEAAQSQLPWSIGNERPLLCWAVPASSATRKRVKRDEVLLFASPELLALLDGPSTTLRANRETGGPRTELLLCPVKPLALTSIVMLADSESSYARAQANSDALQTALTSSDRILRQGQSLAIATSHEDNIGLTLALLEPVLQGYAIQGKTEMTLLPSLPATRRVSRRSSRAHSMSSDQDLPTRATLVNGNGKERALDEVIEHSEDDLSSSDSGTSDFAPDEDGDPFEVDESFLASTVLDVAPQVVQTNGHAEESAALTESTLEWRPLLSPIPEGLLAQSNAGDSLGADSDARVYVRTREMARLGLFSGEWALAGPSDQPTSQRLVKVYAADGVVRDLEARSRTVHASPLLLANWGKTASSRILRSLHCPQRSIALPTAESVEIARIASPHAVNRQYQHLFLAALKTDLEKTQRLVKKGDIIAVTIDEEDARRAFTTSSSHESQANEKTDDHSQDPELQLPLSASNTSGHSTVYFVITNVIFDASGRPNRTDAERIACGEYGAYLDSGKTKVLQAGVEHRSVPDCASYLGIFAPDSTHASSEARAKLCEYLQAALRPSSSEYDLSLSVLVKGARGNGKRTCARSAAKEIGYHLLEIDCYELLGDTDAKTEGLLQARFEKARSCAPCVLLLANVEALARKSQALETGQEPVIASTLQACIESIKEGWKRSGAPVVIVGTTFDVDKIPLSVLGCFKQEISIEAPSEAERLEILKRVTSNDCVSADVSLRALAVQTAALVAIDLVELVARARTIASMRVIAQSPNAHNSDVELAGMPLIGPDFNTALDQARSSYSESIGAPKIPNVTWDDVGGLAAVKNDILDTIQLPLDHPELFADGLKKRSGILLYGPPGTGKTLLAKAVATSCSLNFFSVKGPELLNMYIGESEANVRRVFQRARDAKPCVIFFDELDSVAPKRGNQGDSGGVMDRIVSQLLAELDGMADGKGGSDVFVVGATNRPDLLDPALLRPGRFDRMLYLGVSDTHDAQLKIIQALTRKFKLHPDTDLQRIAESCPFNYTGADFYALCSDAMLKAMTRTAESIDDTLKGINASRTTPIMPQYYLSEMAKPSEIEVLVSQGDFENALAELVPSVSKAEMAHYRTIQGRFSGKGPEPEQLNGHADPAASQARPKGKGKGKAKA